jgi:hypothetical protein
MKRMNLMRLSSVVMVPSKSKNTKLFDTNECFPMINKRAFSIFIINS